MHLTSYEEDFLRPPPNFGFFEAPAHVHTFDESLARCAKRSNNTCPCLMPDFMKNKPLFGFFVVGSQNGCIKARVRAENILFV